jgi:hypothetical protein
VKTKPLSAEEMLEQWGLRITGGSFEFVGFRKQKGGSPTVDEAMAAVRYVESINGFERVRPILLHVYGDGQAIDDYQMFKPGETLPMALMRHGWFYMQGHNPRKIPGLLLEEFKRALEKELQVRPFVPPEASPEVDILEIGASASEAIKAALSNGSRIFSI